MLFVPAEVDRREPGDRHAVLEQARGFRADGRDERHAQRRERARVGGCMRTVAADAADAEASASRKKLERGAASLVARRSRLRRTTRAPGRSRRPRRTTAAGRRCSRRASRGSAASGRSRGAARAGGELPRGLAPPSGGAATKMSCSVTTSDSMPITSEMCVTRREPSTSRWICTSRSKALAICSRIAR